MLLAANWAVSETSTDHLVVKMLLEAGARVDIHNNEHKTAIDMARDLGANNLVVLIQQFSDV